MKHGLIAGAATVFGLVFMLDGNVHGGKDPISIKVVMQKAHKGKDSLLNKVAGGTASNDEKKLLISLYTDLSANKPPKGDEADWKERTKALLDATTAEDSKALKKAANCVGCHNAHKK